MKKLIIIVALIMLTFNVQAERQMKGVIEKVDLEKGVVVFNHVEYKIQKDKTRLFSEEHILNLELLDEGSRVTVVIENGVLTEIRLMTPYEFKR